MKTESLTPVKDIAVFKNKNAFNECDTLVCFIDAKGNSFRKRDFMEASGQNEALALFLFESVITISPYELVEFWKEKGDMPL